MKGEGQNIDDEFKLHVTYIKWFFIIHMELLRLRTKRVRKFMCCCK